MNQPNDTDRLTDLAKKLQLHCEKLDTEGIGAISQMCRQSVVRTLHQDPRFLAIFEREGDMFSAMAEHVAPTTLVAEYMQAVGTHLLQPIFMKSDDADSFFTDLNSMASSTQETLSDELRNHSSSFRYKPSEMKGYLERCITDPTLQLACIYFASELEDFIDVIIDTMETKEHAEGLKAFGTQMNARNLTTAFPLAIHIVLEREHGTGASSDLINQETIQKALLFMDTTEQFEAKGTGLNTTTGKVEPISIRCPMKRYVFDLLLKQQAFIPFLQSVAALSSTSRSREKNDSIEHALHWKNIQTITSSAAKAVRDLA